MGKNQVDPREIELVKISSTSRHQVSRASIAAQQPGPRSPSCTIAGVHKEPRIWDSGTLFTLVAIVALLVQGCTLQLRLTSAQCSLLSALWTQCRLAPLVKVAFFFPNSVFVIQPIVYLVFKNHSQRNLSITMFLYLRDVYIDSNKNKK